MSHRTADTDENHITLQFMSWDQPHERSSVTSWTWDAV